MLLLITKQLLSSGAWRRTGSLRSFCVSVHPASRRINHSKTAPVIKPSQTETETWKDDVEHERRTAAAQGSEQRTSSATIVEGISSSPKFSPLPFSTSQTTSVEKEVPFKPLPFQTTHQSENIPKSSLSQTFSDAKPPRSTKVGADRDFAPIPFQTSRVPLSPEASASQNVAKQNDWLADSDDVSGKTSDILSSLRSAAPLDGKTGLSVNHSARVTGDVPHLDIGETLGDTSFDDARKTQIPIDYTALDKNFTNQFNHRNMKSDADDGYGVSEERLQEQINADQIPFIDPNAVSLPRSAIIRAAAQGKPLPKPLTNARSSEESDLGPIDELIDDSAIVNENRQASVAGYAPGEHLISVGQAAKGARFTETKVADVSTLPGASK